MFCVKLFWLSANTDFGRRLSIQKKRFAAALNPQRLPDILFR